jgi:hypothetical protein
MANGVLTTYAVRCGDVQTINRATTNCQTRLAAQYMQDGPMMKKSVFKISTLLQANRQFIQFLVVRFHEPLIVI